MDPDWQARQVDRRNQRLLDAMRRDLVRPTKKRLLIRRHRLACVLCDRAFAAFRPDARYCSDACRQRAYRLRHPDRSRTRQLRLWKDRQ